MLRVRRCAAQEPGRHEDQTMMTNPETFACNTFTASLGETLPGVYRETPVGQPNAADLCPPGTIVRTSDGTGAYIVLCCSLHAWHDPAGARAWSHHSLALTLADRPHKSPQHWINELVAVDGRLLQLFGNNSDEIFIDGMADAGVKAKLGIEPPPTHALVSEAANDPGCRPKYGRRARLMGPAPQASHHNLSLLLNAVHVTFWPFWPGFRSQVLFEFRGDRLPWKRATYHCCFARRVDVEAAGGPEAYARAFAAVASMTSESRQIRISSARVLKHCRRYREGPSSLFGWADLRST